MSMFCVFFFFYSALQVFLRDKLLTSKDDCKNWLLEFFVNTDQGFYKTYEVIFKIVTNYRTKLKMIIVTKIGGNPKHAK